MPDLPARLRLLVPDGPGEPAPMAPGRLVAGSGEATLWNGFTDPTGRFHAGHWSAPAGIRRIEYTETEVCFILSGRARVCGEDGVCAEFGPGDAFVIEPGFRGTWENAEPLTKLYVILDL